jgi:HEAT repeat protein
VHNNPRQRSFNFKTACLVIFLGSFLVENGNGQDSLKVSQTLVRIVDSPSNKDPVRCSAAKALGVMGATAKDGVESLINTVNSPSNSDEVRRCAAEALGAIAR